jgi:hypothetical protein
MPLAATDQLTEVGDQLLLAAVGLEQRRRRVLTGPEQHPGRDAVRPHAQQPAVLRGQAEQLRDDQHGQGLGQVAHDLQLAAVRYVRKQLVHQVLYARPQAGGALGCECGREQPAQAGVIGRVQVQQPVGLEPPQAPNFVRDRLQRPWDRLVGQGSL